MNRLRDQQGWTLLELMTIVAIVGVISTIAVASLRGYSRREETNSAARSVASVFDTARSEALTTGRMTWVVFKEPANGVAPFDVGQFAALIRDSDNDLQPTAADDVTPIYLPSGARSHASLYDAATSPSGTIVLPDADQSRDVASGNLDNTVDGTTLNVDVNLASPTVGFNSQGFPVKVATALDPGSGAGGVYLTDNESQIVAVLVLPLGEVRTVVYDRVVGNWR